MSGHSGTREKRAVQEFISSLLDYFSKICGSMILIVKKQVPEFLRKSAFYQAIEDEDESFEVPKDCFKANTSIDDENDLRSLLSTLRFWGCDSIPSTLVTYVSLHRPKEVVSSFAEFQNDLRFVRFLQELCEATENISRARRKLTYQDRYFADTGSVYKTAARICRLQYEASNGNVWNAGTCTLAASRGKIDALKFFHEHGCPWDIHTCSSAARAGHLEVLKYAHEQGCPWMEGTCSYAAANGCLAILEYAVENGCPWGEVTFNAAASSHYDNNKACYQYLAERKVHNRNSPALCAKAAKDANLPLLQQLRAQGCPWNATTCSGAVYGGSLNVLQWAHENGCPWDANTCSEAAVRSLQCLKYAHENGCPWDERTTAKAAWGSFGLGNLDILQYAHENGCPWNESVAAVAAKNRNLILLQYVVGNGCPCDETAVNTAAKHRLSANLGYLLSRGCPYTNDTCSIAAAASLECLVIAHEHGCPWDKDTCAAAARADKLDCLQYLRTDGCPWDIGTVRAAMEGGALRCLKYAHENGCSWDAKLAMEVPLTLKTRKCIEYVRDHPEPVPPAPAVVAKEMPGVAAATQTVSKVTKKQRRSTKLGMVSIGAPEATAQLSVVQPTEVNAKEQIQVKTVVKDEVKVEVKAEVKVKDEVKVKAEVKVEVKQEPSDAVAEVTGKKRRRQRSTDTTGRKKKRC